MRNDCRYKTSPSHSHVFPRVATMSPDSLSLYALNYEEFVRQSYFTVSARGLFLFDYCITFGEEVSWVWTRRMNVATVLFLTNRYINLVATILVLLDNAPFQNAQAMLVTSLFITSAFTTLRVYALWGRDWRPALPVFILSLVSPVLNIASHHLMTLKLTRADGRLLLRPAATSSDDVQHVHHSQSGQHGRLRCCCFDFDSCRHNASQAAAAILRSRPPLPDRAHHQRWFTVLPGHAHPQRSPNDTRCSTTGQQLPLLLRHATDLHAPLALPPPPPGSSVPEAARRSDVVRPHAHLWLRIAVQRGCRRVPDVLAAQQSARAGPPGQHDSAVVMHQTRP